MMEHIETTLDHNSGYCTLIVGMQKLDLHDNPYELAESKSTENQESGTDKKIKMRNLETSQEQQA